MRNLTPQMPGETGPAGELPEGAADQQQADKPKPGRKPRAAMERPAGELPDQSEVDASKLSRAVLTKQGWVCPLESGPRPKGG